MNDEYIRGKTKEQLVNDLYATADPGTRVHEQLKMAIVAKCTDEVVAQMDKLCRSIATSSASADRLGRKVLWLNVVLVAATIVGVLATAGMVGKGRSERPSVTGPPR